MQLNTSSRDQYLLRLCIRFVEQTFEVHTLNQEKKTNVFFLDETTEMTHEKYFQRES